MKTSEVARRIGVSTAAVRQWTGKGGPYTDFLSASARGGQVREFTDQDVRILKAAKQLVDQNMTFEDARERLKEWRSNGWRDLPEVPGLPDEDATRLISVDAATMAVEKARESLTLQLKTLEGEIMRLEEALATEQAERHVLQTRLEDAIGQRERLAGQLEGGQHERALYRVVLVVVAVLAALALVGLWLTLTGGVG